jgi:O-antigen/teichoic acid export membrane protein
MTPAITRLYGTEAYGLQSVFMAAVSITGAMATLNLPMAIPLPTREGEALGLAKLSLLLGCVSAAVLLILALASSSGKIFYFIDLTGVPLSQYLLPIATVLAAASTVLSFYLTRLRLFSVIARATVVQAAASTAAKLLIGFLSPTALALVVVNAISAAIGIGAMLAGARNVTGSLGRSSRTRVALLPLLRKYSDFPLYRTPQTLISTCVQSVPVLMLASYASPSVAGQYALANSVLLAPVVLVGSAVSQAAYPRIVEALRVGGRDLQRFLVKSTLYLIGLTLIPGAVLVFWAPSIFSALFGVEWQEAGLFSQVLFVWVALQFSNKVAVTAIPPLKLQRGLLIYELVTSLVRVSALWWALEHTSVLVAIGFFASVGAVSYIGLIGWVLYVSAGGKSRTP